MSSFSSGTELGILILETNLPIDDASQLTAILYDDPQCQTPVVQYSVCKTLTCPILNKCVQSIFSGKPLLSSFWHGKFHLALPCIFCSRGLFQKLCGVLSTFCKINDVLSENSYLENIHFKTELKRKYF